VADYRLLIFDWDGTLSDSIGYGAQSLDALRVHGPRLAIDEFFQLRAWLQGALTEQSREVVRA
jgi:phosphoglycolate phosphatase